MKTTPATLPTVAVPTDRIPAGVNVIPAGSFAPDGLTAKAPPRATPAGKVVARLKVPPLPTANVGGFTTHAADAGGAAGGGGVTVTVGSSARTSQPTSESAPDANPKHKTVRRPNLFIRLGFRQRYLLLITPLTCLCQPRFPRAGFNDGRPRGAIPGFDLMHYVMWTRDAGSACTARKSRRRRPQTRSRARERALSPIFAGVSGLIEPNDVFKRLPLSQQ